MFIIDFMILRMLLLHYLSKLEEENLDFYYGASLYYRLDYVLGDACVFFSVLFVLCCNILDPYASVLAVIHI